MNLLLRSRDTRKDLEYYLCRHCIVTESMIRRRNTYDPTRNDDIIVLFILEVFSGNLKNGLRDYCCPGQIQQDFFS